MILSVAMMLHYSFDMDKAAQDIENAVDAVLDKGYRTADIAEKDKKTVGTGKMGNLIAQEIGNTD
jgi:3-isopropylmalate dehydrogenase